MPFLLPPEFQNPTSYDVNFETRTEGWGHNPALGCPYFGPTSSEHYTATWTNSSLGHQVMLMSHYCVNGSASSLESDEWYKLCFPTHKDAGGIGRTLAGVWALVTMIVGIFGNLLTLIAIPYAKWNRRYDIHKNFYTTHIWILHLALCELIWCIFPLPVLFVVPYLGYRYAQAPGMDTALRAFFIIGHQTVYIDWLLLTIIVMTRAIYVMFPMQWRNFCKNKIYVSILLLSPWIISTFYIMPHLIQPSLDFGYHCLFGYSTYIPTGEAPLQFLVDNKWVVDLLPGIIAFFLPCGVIIISFTLIGKRLLENRRRKDTVSHEDCGHLTAMEMKFIWTVLIVCLCYVVVAGPLAFAKMFRELRTPTSMLVIISLMLCQYVVNFLIYAYRCSQYADAYWDTIIIVLPCAAKLRSKWRTTDVLKKLSIKSNSTKESNISTK